MKYANKAGEEKQKEREYKVRCWCRKSDYCNIDLADRVEDGDLLSEKFKEESIIKAEELSTVSMEKILPQKDEFVIEKTYDVNDENYPIYSPDIITGVEETDTFSMLPSSAKPEPSLPARSIEQLITVNRTGLTKTTIPPWRREVPVPLEPASTSQRMLLLPPQMPRTVPIFSVTVPQISESGYSSLTSATVLPTMSSSTLSTVLTRLLQPKPYKSSLDMSENTRMSLMQNRTLHHGKKFENRTQWSLSNFHSFISQTPKSIISSNYRSFQLNLTRYTTTEQPLTTNNKISIGRINTYLDAIVYPSASSLPRQNIAEVSTNTVSSQASPSTTLTTPIIAPSTSERTTKSLTLTNLMKTTAAELSTAKPITTPSRPVTLKSWTTELMTTTLTIRKALKIEPPKIILQQVPKTKLDLLRDNTKSSFVIKFTSLTILSLLWISL